MVFTQTCIQARTCSQKQLFAQSQGSFKSLYKIRSSHLRASAKSETWAKGQRKSLQNQNCSILKGCFQHLWSGDLWEIGLWSADGNWSAGERWFLTFVLYGSLSPTKNIAYQTYKKDSEHFFKHIQALSFHVVSCDDVDCFCMLMEFVGCF